MFEAEYGDLFSLDVARLSVLFVQKRGDPDFLDALNEVLKHRDSDEALDLQMKAIRARRAFPRLTSQTKAVVRPEQVSTVRDWLTYFQSVRNLVRPDSRALYRYRMNDAEYADAKSILRSLAGSGRLTNPDRHAGALFVSFCAEWFRRESDSTFLKWDNLAPDIFPSVPYSSKQQLTIWGLEYWRRRLRRGENGREFLLTLALEGGFPVRILAEGARGWLKDYLRSIMRRAIASRIESGADILIIALEERGRMRKTYQHDDFIALCSELVQSVLDLRRKAEAENAGGVRNSTMLDAKYPGWRDELPVYVPPEAEALVTELLTGLLDEKMTGLSSAGVEVKRYLVKRNGEWLPAVQLLADGEVSASRLPGLSSTGRVRAVPTGELANHLTGDLALLEAPLGEQRHWRVRPFTRIAKLLTGFRFTSPVTTTLTSADGSPLSWTWPRGEALRSDLLVFQQDEGASPGEPLLRYLRSGSISSPAKMLYVLVPDEWSIEASNDDAIVEIESVPSLRRKLVRLAGTAYFRSNDSDSARFRIEPDTEGRERELQLGGIVDPGFVLAEEQWELAETPLSPLIGEKGKQKGRVPASGELFFRRPGGRWVSLSGPLRGAGLIELSWRDPVADIQIERRLLALVPSGAHLRGTMRGALNGDIRLFGLSGWSASVDQGSCKVDKTDPSVITIEFSSRPIYRLPVRLHPPQGHAFDVIVPLVGRDAVIALADGSILSSGAQLDVGSLRGAVAVSPRRAIAQLAPKGSRSGGLKVVVDGELPLGILRSAIDETLATLSGQDDVVELEFLGDTRRPVRISRYRHSQLVIDAGLVRWTPPSGQSSATPVARMISNPRHEHALEPQEDGIWRIPERCTGLCLVYLRDGVDVVSRPVPALRPGAPVGYDSKLLSALLIPEFEERQREINQALDELGRAEGDSRDLMWLLDAATNLNGLPAIVFDVLRLLPTKAPALARLLFGVRDAGERAVIWSLQNELPFLWLAIPVSVWGNVLRIEFESFATALEPVFGREKATGEALDRLKRIRDELVALEPALEFVFGLSNLPSERIPEIPSLQELTSGYIAGQYDRGAEAPNDLGAWLNRAGVSLPAEIETKTHQEFSGLFAPVLLAAAAREKIVLDRDHALLTRRALREDPLYVSASWCRLLKYYA